MIPQNSPLKYAWKIQNVPYSCLTAENNGFPYINCPNNHVSPLLTANYLSHRPKPLWVWLWRVEFPCLTGVYRVAPAETVRHGVLVYVSPVWASTNPVSPTETNVNYLWDMAQLGEMWKPCIPNVSPCLTGVHHPTTSCLSVYTVHVSPLKTMVLHTSTAQIIMSHRC